MRSTTRPTRSCSRCCSKQGVRAACLRRASCARRTESRRKHVLHGNRTPYPASKEKARGDVKSHPGFSCSCGQARLPFPLESPGKPLPLDVLPLSFLGIAFVIFSCWRGEWLRQVRARAGLACAAVARCGARSPWSSLPRRARWHRARALVRWCRTRQRKGSR